MGRTDRVAYAYLMYRKNKVLTDDRETPFCRGIHQPRFRLQNSRARSAIRGAGDILGRNNRFHHAVGLDMYMKLLSEGHQQGPQQSAPEEEKPVLINVSKHVDESYVSDDEIKILIHKEILKSKTRKTRRGNPGINRPLWKAQRRNLAYIEERYLQSLLKRYGIKEVLEARHSHGRISKKKPL